MSMKDKIKKIINYKYVKKGKDTLQKKAVKYLGVFLFLMIICTMLSRFADSLTIPVIQTDKPKVKTMVDEVKAQGRVVKNREEKIPVIEGLKIDYVNVSVGATVKEGDVLVELNTDDLKKKVDDIKEKIANDEKTLARAQEDYNRAIASKNEAVTRASSEMNNAKKALEDYKALPEEEKDEMVEQNLNMEYESKKSMYDEAVKQANDTLDLDRILQDVKESLKLDEYYKELEKIQPLVDLGGKVKSTKEGVVTSVFAENGGMTTDTVISIADVTSGYKFVGQIEASKRNLVKQGQTVDLNLSTAGYIEKLTIEAISKSSENPDMINITVTLPAGVSEIDDTGDIIISSKAKKYGTCVPLAALRQGDGSNYYVLVVSEKETVLGVEKIAKKVEVKVEKKDNEFAALSEGIIARNEAVIVGSNKTVEDGDRVRLETE